MRFGRAALVALVVGAVLILVGPLSGLIYPDVIGYLRETQGMNHTFFAVRNFLNFVNGGLPNFVAFMSFAASAILWGLRK